MKGIQLGEYWRIASEEALCEAGFDATEEQVSTVGLWFQRAAEMHGEYTGQHLIPNPLVEENEKLQKLLKKEMAKVYCPACNGTGRIQYSAGPWAVDTSCDNCRGEGRINP